MRCKGRGAAVALCGAVARVMATVVQLNTAAAMGYQYQIKTISIVSLSQTSHP
jgi:hypothetical protein